MDEFWIFENPIYIYISIFFLEPLFYDALTIENAFDKI